jgi:hypothetical protein
VIGVASVLVGCYAALFLILALAGRPAETASENALFFVAIALANGAVDAVATGAATPRLSEAGAGKAGRRFARAEVERRRPKSAPGGQRSRPPPGATYLTRGRGRVRRRFAPHQLRLSRGPLRRTPCAPAGAA